MSQSKGRSSEQENGRRRDRRRPVLATFSIFIVISQKGIHRLQVNDVSELGIGFDLDVEGEHTSDFKVSVGEKLDLRFYINLSLYIPLSVCLTRIEERPSGRRIGAELENKESENYKAFQSFLNMIDHMSDILKIDSGVQG